MLISAPTQDNCWFFCSIIQQCLDRSHRGQFTKGGSLKPELGKDMRQRISEAHAKTDVLRLHKEARASNEKSLAHCRQLYAADPEQHRAALANALRDLGISLQVLSLYGEARASYVESVDLYRILHAADLQKHGASLASTLCELALTMSWLDLWRDARAVAEEAVSLYGQCSAADIHGDTLARLKRHLEVYKRKDADVER